VKSHKRVQSSIGRLFRCSRTVLSSAFLCAEFIAFTTQAQAQEFPSPADELRSGELRSGRTLSETTSPPLIRRGWQFSAIGRTDLTVTDNAYLTRNNRESDFIVSPIAAFLASETSSKSVFDARIEVAHDFYANASDLNGPRINGLADGTLRLADEAFSLRARAGTSLLSSSPQGAVAATERSIGSNQVQVVSYGLSPMLRQPISDNLFAEAHYEFSGVSFLKAPTGATNVAASDSIQQKAEAKLSNDTKGAIVGWDLTGSYEQRDLSKTGPTSRRARGEANVEYRVTPTVALLTTGGYEWFDEPTLFNERLNGLYGRGGVLLRPSSRTSLRLEAGYRYRKPNYVAELTYNSSQRLIISARFDQGIDTSQGALNDAFGRVGRDETGIIIDPLTGLSPDFSTSPFDLNNQSFRFSRASVRIQGTLGRSFYNASGSYERRSLRGIKGETWGGNLILGRDLSRRLSATVEGQYTKTNSPTLTILPGLNSETTRGEARLNYRMAESLSSSLRYVYLKRSTNLIDYRENAAVLSITKSF